MLEFIATTTLIFLLHILITAWKRRKVNNLRLQATNQIEKRGSNIRIPSLIKELLRGKP